MTLLKLVSTENWSFFYSFFFYLRRKHFTDRYTNILSFYVAMFRMEGFPDKRFQSIEIFLWSSWMFASFCCLKYFCLNFFLHSLFNTMDYNEIIMQLCNDAKRFMMNFRIYVVANTKFSFLFISIYLILRVTI